MNRFATPVSVFLALLMLAACSKEPATPAPGAAPASSTQTSSTQPAATPAAEENATDEAVAAAPEAVSETDDVPAEETPAATGAQPSIRLGNTAGPATSARFKEGTHYQKIVPAQPTGAAPGKVEVVEVFWYGCPHCFTLDPAIESWRNKGKAPYVEFVRVPAMWNDGLRMHARVFYTAELLGKLEELHTLIFRETQVNQNPLNSVDSIAAFFKQHGVSREEFQKAFSSFAVESKLQRADVLNRRYRVDSVPMVVVNGKYLTDIGKAGGEQQLFALINELAAHEHGG